MKKRILKWLGVEAMLTAQNELIAELQKKIDSQNEERAAKDEENEKLHQDDYKFVAKRLNDLEEEVFDCSDDTEWDEDGNVIEK